MDVTAFGAAGQVTGSCHLVDAADFRLLLDCGMYQGPEEKRNTASFGFDPGSLDAVVVSHTHLDHVGRLPRLYREGCSAPVYAHPATNTLIPLILRDALKVMLEDRGRAERHGEPPPEPWWDESDLEALESHLVDLPYYQPTAIGPLQVELKNAGHLPGSAFVEVGGVGCRLTYSGDLGNHRKEILADADFPVLADLVLCEATYGDRSHRPFQATIEEFAEVLSSTLRAGGKVLVPSFALERTQEVLFHLREFEERGRVPIAPVFLDSPLGVGVTRAYESMSDVFGMEVQLLLQRGESPFRTADLRFTESVEASRRINHFDGAATIIAGSGMFHGGRILHHMRRHLQDGRNSLLILGYQPEGGLGRALIDGRKTLRIFGGDVRVNAGIHTIGGFSGHADRDELLEWLEEQPRVALVHGDRGGLVSLQQALAERGQEAFVAEHGSPIKL